MEKYNRLAKGLGQTEAASLDKIIYSFEHYITFTRVGHYKSGIFTVGEHWWPGTTQFWLQGNPLTSYGRRVARHELIHLGAALNGQGDTILHELAVQMATTPENLLIAGGAVVVVIGGEVYLLSK